MLELAVIDIGFSFISQEYIQIRHLVKTWKETPTENAETRQSVRRMEKLPNRNNPRHV